MTAMNAADVRKALCKAGSTVGFTAAGESVTCKWLRTSKTWQIAVCDAKNGTAALADARNTRRESAADAAAYAASLCDAETTSRLAWWN